MILNSGAAGGGGGLKVVAEASLYIEAGATEIINLDAAAKFAIVSFDNTGSKTGVAIADGPAESLAMGAQFVLTNGGMQLQLIGGTYRSQFRYIAIG